MTEPSTSGKRHREDEGVGNLGWLASSGMLPRKRQDISGVGNASIMELQAQLYRTQENVKLKASGVEVPDRRTSGFNVASLMQRRNTGVEERDRRDKLEVKVRRGLGVRKCDVGAVLRLTRTLASAVLDDAPRGFPSTPLPHRPPLTASGSVTPR